MRFFGLGRAKHRSLPPLLKCVHCQRRPGEVFHHQLPLCKPCFRTLNHDIVQHGRAIIETVNTLNVSSPECGKSDLIRNIVGHASKLLAYQDERLKTIEPQPSEIIRLARADELKGIDLRLFNDE